MVTMVCHRQNDGTVLLAHRPVICRNMEQSKNHLTGEELVDTLGPRI